LAPVTYTGPEQPIDRVEVERGVLVAIALVDLARAGHLQVELDHVPRGDLERRLGVDLPAVVRPGPV
jgi:hypothetical protein